jgi:hypothetical protein
MTDSELQDNVIKTDEDTAKEDSGDSGGLYPFGIIYQPSIEEIDRNATMINLLVNAAQENLNQK